jgi:hypothetical protein
MTTGDGFEFHWPGFHSTKKCDKCGKYWGYDGTEKCLLHQGWEKDSELWVCPTCVTNALIDSWIKEDKNATKNGKWKNYYNRISNILWAMLPRVFLRRFLERFKRS